MAFEITVPPAATDALSQQLVALPAVMGLTLAWLLAAGETTPAALATNPEVHHLRYPGLPELLVSGAGAVAGVIMLAAYRRSFQAGPLIAQALIPAAALVGAGLAAGHPALATAGLLRFGMDAGFILGAGLVVFGLKQALVHRRAPLV